MRILCIMMMLCVSSVLASPVQSQSARITLSAPTMTTGQLISQIEEQSNYLFIYKESEVDLHREVSVRVKDRPVSEVLKKAFAGTNVTYAVEGQSIMLMKKAPAKAAQVAQTDIRITGVVVDDSGLPVIGASVREVDGTHATITDLDGKFTISVASKDSKLAIHFVGYRPSTIVVGNRRDLHITIHEDTQTLDEVVVVGYGVQKKKLVTGATVQVKGEDIQKQNTVNALGALQVSSPGVNIVKTSGQPGSSFKVAVRGIGTTGDSAPLYVVDGVTVGSIDHIAPSDIESIDVLKDAASAAIYGARAANGVVLITTKQGKAGRAQISYDGYVGIQKIVDRMHPLNAQEYMDIMDEQQTNVGGQPYNWANLIDSYQDIQNGWKGADYFDALINDNAITQSHSLNVTGGTKQSVYSIGLAYTKQEGLIGHPADPEYERYNVRVNTEHTLISKDDKPILKLGENINLSRAVRNVMPTDGQWNGIRNSMMMHPLMPIKDADGNYTTADGYEGWQDRANPQGMLYYNNKFNENKTNRLVGNMYATLTPIKGLTIRSSFGIDGRSVSYRRYVPEYYMSPIKFEVDDKVTQSINTGYKYIFENSATYKRTIGKHTASILAGTSYEKSGMGDNLGVTNTGSTFDDYDHAYINNANVVEAGRTTISGSPYAQQRLMSYFGRINYNYNETYMATVVMRADGSSNFSKDNRWGYFPSVSAGWVVTNEAFMEDNKPEWLEFLKIRASWGQNGNQNINPFQYLSTIAYNANYALGTDYMLYSQGAYPDILANPDVTWETSEQIDIGIDARFLDGRLGLVFDWYNKETKDWLVQAPISGVIGTGAPYINGGDVRNRGFELGLTWQDAINDFHYKANINLSHNDNEVLRIANSEGIIHGPENIVRNLSPEMYRAQEGYPVGYFLGYKTAGIFQTQEQIDNYVNSKGEKIMPDAQPGDLIFVNRNDDDTIDTADKTMIGDPNPDYNISFGFSCNYRGFDFALSASGVMGNQIFRMYRGWGADPTFNYMHEDIDGHWTPENPSNSVPRVTPNGKNDLYISDRYVEDGDYLRINNITLGYDFKKLFPASPLSKMRVYTSVQNAYTFTDYKGLDPEVGSGDNWAGGIDLGMYPTPRTFIFGVSLNY